MILVFSKRTSLAIVLIGFGLIGLILIGMFPLRSYSIDNALNVAENYLGSLNNPDLAINEIMEFEQNFYVIYYEKSTGIGAFEMLIDKSTGRIFPEYGPNMMWNTKYGHGGMMGGGSGMMGNWSPLQSELISEDDVLKAAQGFLDRVYPGTVADDPHPFYGYYTLHATRDERVFGMLSVNSFGGAVWYHSWHGDYIQSHETH